MIKNGIVLYIDPGTGSMLFTILIGLLGTGMFLIKKIWIKLRFRLTGGKISVSEENMPYVLFSDSKNYWTTFKPICDEFEKRGVEACYWTASPDDPLLEEKYKNVKCEFIGEGNKAFAKLNLMHADICLSTTPGLDVYQWKRSRYVRYYVHIMHSAATTLLYRMFGMDYYDALLLTGDFQVQEVRELEKVRRDPHKELEVVGCVYLDGLREKAERNKPAANENGDRTVLVAPSWGETALLRKYGDKLLAALEKTGYIIVIRPHPQSMRSEKDMIDDLMSKHPESKKLKWNFDTDNFDALNRADIMITDFSAVILDFALVFDKPVVYAEYELDKDVYDAAWIDHLLWQEKMIPKLGTPLREGQLNNIKSIIDDAILSTEYEVGRKQAREEAWMHIGQSAKLTVDYLLNKRAQLNLDKKANIDEE